MAQTIFGGTTVNTNGELPAKGEAAPAFTVTKTDMTSLSSADIAGKKVVLNIFPSVDTGICAASVREFNKRAAGLENTAVLCVSADLPFAMRRFCGAEGIDNVTLGSTFRNPEFLSDFGVKLVEGGFAGLAARAVVVLDTDGTVAYTQMVPEIGQEPDYDAALAAL